jgi:hypothetical protein
VEQLKITPARKSAKTTIMEFHVPVKRAAAIMNAISERIWSATAEVVPHVGNEALGNATGAYVAVVGLGSGESQFRERVIRAMNALDFDVVDFDDVEQLESTAHLTRLGDLMADRARASTEVNPIEVGTFQAFSDHDQPN